LGVHGSKLYIIHWFQCQAKVGSRPFMEFRNIQKKVPFLLRVTVVGMLIPILLLFNVYLMMYLNLYPTRAKLEVQRFTIVVYMYIWIIRQNYSGNSLQAVIFFWQIFATLQCHWEKNKVFWSVKCVCFATFVKSKFYYKKLCLYLCVEWHLLGSSCRLFSFNVLFCTYIPWKTHF
jgi:hypothetical protein